MKTRKQILEWLDKQPWKNEFYENCFRSNMCEGQLTYDENFINEAFEWSKTKQGYIIWENREDDFRKWYNSNSKPMSWEEYCEQNKVTEDDWFIDSDSQVVNHRIEHHRCPEGDVNVMSKELCEAFVAYMKLIQLRDAWVKGADDVNMYYKIVSVDNLLDVKRVRHSANGLSFYILDMAAEFFSTFKDLLEIAKPLI